MKTQCHECKQVFKSTQAWDEHDCPDFDSEAFGRLPLKLMRLVAMDELTIEQAQAQAEQEKI